MGGVDEHFVGHETVSWRRARTRRASTEARGAPNLGLDEWPWAVRAGANANALPTTLICSPGRRGEPAPCALSMTLDLDWTAALWRAAAVSSVPTGLDWREIRLYPDVLKGLGSFRSQRLGRLKRTDLWRPAMSVPARGTGVFRGRRMPERGKSRFATVSNTYIRGADADGKRGKSIAR